MRVERIVRMLLAIVLASYVCVPVPALALESVDVSDVATVQEGIPGDAGLTASYGAGQDDVTVDEDQDNIEFDGVEQGFAIQDVDAEPGTAAEALPETVASDDTQDVVDITDAWQAGEARIDASGSYKLSADVHATAPLVVALPEGAEATFDLGGFSAVVDGDAACAIDLSGNAGTVAFVDAENVEPELRSSITLKAKDSKEDVAVVNGVRTADLIESNSHAVFDHVRLSVDATTTTADAYGKAITAIRTGVECEPKREADAEKAIARISLVNSALSVKTAADTSSPDIERAIGEGATRGTASAIDARCRGIEIIGRFAVATSLDGDEGADTLRGVLFSKYDTSFTVGPDFELVDANGGAYITFAFPSDNQYDDSNEAVVAKAADGKSISEEASSVMRSEAGYSLQLEQSHERRDGYAFAKLVRDAQPIASDVSSAASAEADSARDQVLTGEEVPTEGIANIYIAPGGATPHVYAKHLAAHRDEAVYAYELKTQKDGTDLNRDWADLSSPYTIESGGVYYLSADLATNNNLVVNAPGKDIVIRLSGHTLTLNGSGSSAEKTMVSIVAAKSVTFDGSSTAGSSTIKSAGENDVWGISSTASDCSVSANDLAITMQSTSPAQRYLSTHAIRMDGGTLALTNCTVNMLMGNQTLSSSSLANDVGEAPSAVFATANTVSVTLEDCAVTGDGTQGFACALNDISSLGNAYALYSLAGSTKVAGGTYKASSLRGNATCLYGTNLTIAASSQGASVSLTANAGQLASGVLSTVSGGVAIDCPLVFGSDEAYEAYAQVEAALRSQVAGGFVFGDCAVAAGGLPYSVLVMTADDEINAANANGYIIGTYRASLDAAKKDAIVASLSNALGAGCSITVNALGQIGFRFDASSTEGAVAQIGSVSYPTLASALEAFSKGDTLTLLADAGAVEVSAVNEGTLDLNGHAIASLTYSAEAGGSGLTVRNGSVRGTQLLNGMRISVYQNSESPLTLSNVSVQASGTDMNVYGIYAIASSGLLTVKDGTSVNVMATRVSGTAAAYGIGMPSSGTGPLLAIDHSQIQAATGSAGVGAYGVFCTNGASVEGSSIIVRGTTATTGALSVLGVLDVSNTVLDVYASGASAASSAFGIWARSSAGTKVEADSCTIRVNCAVDASQFPYACLLGSTSELVNSQASWTLSGKNVLVSSSGLHMGLNLGAIELRKGFSLETGSDDDIVISQMRQADDVGFTVEEGFDQGQLEDLAQRFSAKRGSYYEGRSLAVDEEGMRLVWRSEGIAGDAISLIRNSTEKAGYSTLADALTAAESGDTIRLNGDLTEPGVQTASIDNVTLDLNGHQLTMRAGGVKATSKDSYDALKFTGSGTMLIKGGTLDIQVGVASEVVRASSVPYQGIAVTNGGMLSVSSDATINVSYVGSTSSTASQRSVALRGIAVMSGALDLNGKLNVSGSAIENGIGAMTTYGVISQSGLAESVRVASGAEVNVVSASAASTVANAYYAETTYNATSNDGPNGLREIVIDEKADAAFYRDVIDAFRVSATYDDPNDITNRNGFKVSAYYVNGMVLSREGAWYDGLRIWAYTDVVPETEVGSTSALVPTHVFVSSHYDVLPEAHGVATSASAAEGSTVSIKGQVSVKCPNGNSYALNAAGSSSWVCDGATLIAEADDNVHPIAQRSFDLRDYIDYPTEQSKAVVYPGTAAAKVVAFEPTVARDVVVGENATFTFAGTQALATSALDAAQVEAATFKVTNTFGLDGGDSYSSICEVANPAGANVSGTVFALGASRVQAGLFEDAYKVCKVSTTSQGATWGSSSNQVVTFQVGDAVVSRYSDAGSIDLAEPSAKAQRVDDLRQTYTLLGWSLSPDEHATGGYETVSSTIVPAEGATYYAVYDTGLVNVPVTFTNIFDDAGSLQDDVVLQARYGQTVTDALNASGSTLPQPADYKDAGLEYRFVGWYPYSASTSSGALLYDADKLADLEITLSVNGVASTGLVLRAVYIATRSDQHLISFKVDGYTSACVVDDGARPVFTSANSTNTNYVSPAKQDTDDGKNYIFSAWYSDANGDGDYSAGEQSYAGVLPKATADATYVADFTWEWADVTLTFYVEYYDAEADALVTNGVRVIATTYEEETQAVADSIVKVGDVFGYGGKTYTFEGWSVRRADKEPIYTADNHLPSLNGDDRALSSSYQKTYYGVYTVADHLVNVSFYESDGSTLIGKTKGVVAINTSVDSAFAATGASVPENAPSGESFLGWAVVAGSSTALDGTATMVEDLVDYSDTALDLYAVYGKVPTYVVRLRNEDGSKVLYQLQVKRGATVASVLRANDITVSLPSQSGKYFAGWYTANGDYYGLDAPVMGSASVYARYGNIEVRTPDDKDLSSTVALTSDTYSSLGLYEELSGVSLAFTARDTADTLLHSQMSTYGYTVLKSYTMKLVASYVSGDEVVKEGSVATTSIKTYVGKKYKNAQVRVFWLGFDEHGNEKVMNSAVKEIDDDGYITVSIGNYEVGDEDEGGNIAIGYVEGGSGDGKLPSDDEDDGTDDKPGVTPSNTDDSSSASGASGLDSGGGLSGLSSGGLSSSGLASASSGLSGSSASGGAGAGAKASAKANALGAEAADADSALVEGEVEEESFFADWDSDAVVLLLLTAVALAAIVYGLWRLIVVRPRRSEQEAEMPIMTDQYAEGLHF